MSCISVNNSNIRTGEIVSEDRSQTAPQSVGRIFAILDVLADTKAGATLSELSAAVGAPKSSLVGLLNGLLEERCVVRNSDGRYLPGSRLSSLSLRMMSGRELSIVVRPILSRLVAATGETAVLGELAPEGDMAIYIDKIESSNPIRYAVNVGERRELYCTALGKMLLAWFEPAQQQQYLAKTKFQRFTPTTITSGAKLRAELERIRTEGIARTEEERIQYADALAAPIFTRGGKFVAALLIAGPSERMRLNKVRVEEGLRAAAEECSRLIGGASANRT
jgi:DNA-binding IclR family transcriptional regulator